MVLVEMLLAWFGFLSGFLTAILDLMTGGGAG